MPIDQAPTCGERARRAQFDAALLDCRIHGLAPVHAGAVTLVPTGMPHPQWNGAWFTAIPADVDAALAASDAGFRSWGVPYGIVVPADLDTCLRGPLLAAGASWLFPLRLMEREIEPLPAVRPPCGVKIRPAAGSQDYTDLLELQATCFGDDTALWDHYLRPRYAHPDVIDLLAVVADEIVGTGTLVVVGEAAGLYGIAVAPLWRRQGVGAVLTAAVLEAAARRGCRVAHLNPSNAGTRTYRRLGFRDVPGFQIWAPPRPDEPRLR